MVCELKKARKVRSQYRLQWLLCAIIPNYHSISDFRKQNPGIKESVQTLCFFPKDADLIVKSSLLMAPKQSTTARKLTSIKEN
jgi:hypothetical protein